VQPKLLRVMESRAVKRVGEVHERPIDVRFVAATHRDLGAMVNEGTFREDLYFRIAVLPVLLPPLRARTEDIPLLVEHFSPAKARLSAEVQRELGTRPWRGNVRELRNFVERALVFGEGQALQMPAGIAADDRLPAVPLDLPFKEVRERWLDHLEREYLRGLLAKHGGNVKAAAQAAGLDRTHVHRLIRKHGI
jgi:DNA-binding NtrC family response regulator